jgi:hypothetical protein
MKKILILLLFPFAIFGQTADTKTGFIGQWYQVTPHTIPTVITDKLYNLNHRLYFNGSKLDSASKVGGALWNIVDTTLTINGSLVFTAIDSLNNTGRYITVKDQTIYDTVTPGRPGTELKIKAGASNGNDGGILWLMGGEVKNDSICMGRGGHVILVGADSYESGQAGGEVQLNGGDGLKYDNSDGGPVRLFGGDAKHQGVGGEIYLAAGNSDNGNGGSVLIQSGVSSSNGYDGLINLYSSNKIILNANYNFGDDFQTVTLDSTVLKSTAPIEGIDSTAAFILRSPNGYRWKVRVTNTGTLTITQIP